MAVKKSNPMDKAQVRRAVIALKQVVENQKDEAVKAPLIESTEYLSTILTLRKIPSKSSVKPISIDLPHALRGDSNDVEMCLFVKDSDKDRIKKALAEDPVPGLTKIMTVKKLRKEFARFADRRNLAGAYDLFLADDRIVEYLKGYLGAKFFAKKKQAVAVRVSKKNPSNEIRKAYSRTVMHVNSGVCVNIKMAHFGMEVDEIVDNVMIGTNNAVEHVAKKWGGIQSVNVKTPDSIALPVYNSLAEPTSDDEASSTSKRKREDDEDEEEEPSSDDKPVKKTKKAKKAAEEKPAKKAAETKPAKKTKKTKEETVVEKPVKKAKEEAAVEKPAKKAKKTKETVATKPAKKATKAKEEVLIEKPAKKAKKTKEETAVTKPAKKATKADEEEVEKPAKKAKKATKVNEEPVVAKPAKKSKKVEAAPAKGKKTASKKRSKKQE